MPALALADVAKHNTASDCWIVLHGKAWNVTRFLPDHPGGQDVILRYAGKDATVEFDSFHPPGTVEELLKPEECLGEVEGAREELGGSEKVGTKLLGGQVAVARNKVEEKGGEEEWVKPPVDQIISLKDFEEAAPRVLTPKAWAYISSGATDEVTLGLNRASFSSVLFLPRTLVNVATVTTSTTLLRHKVSLPIFVAPAGMAKMSGEPEGERALARATGAEGVGMMISSNASATVESILSARRVSPSNTTTVDPVPPFLFQLYVNKDRAKAEALVRKVCSLDDGAGTARGGVKAIVVTVDAATPGKREADERSKADLAGMTSSISGAQYASDSKGGGIGRTMGTYIDPTLSWKDIVWLRKLTDLPVGVKGIQTVEDALKAAELGCDVIYLSNHGGRALDGAPPPLTTLLSLRLHHPTFFTRVSPLSRTGRAPEIYLDGGVWRGTDVVKALCLGARAVGLGRAFMYALAWGEPGVRKGIEVLRDEIETTLKLLGVTSLDQLGPHLLNTKMLERDLPDPLPGVEKKGWIWRWGAAKL